MVRYVIDKMFYVVTIILLFQDMVYLERELRKAVTQGQPRTHRPWRKIFLLVEGIYRFVIIVCIKVAVKRLAHAIN